MYICKLKIKRLQIWIYNQPLPMPSSKFIKCAITHYIGCRTIEIDIFFITTIIWYNNFIMHHQFCLIPIYFRKLNFSVCDKVLVRVRFRGLKCNLHSEQKIDFFLYCIILKIHIQTKNSVCIKPNKKFNENKILHITINSTDNKENINMSIYIKKLLFLKNIGIIIQAIVIIINNPIITGFSFIISKKTGIVKIVLLTIHLKEKQLLSYAIDIKKKILINEVNSQ